MQIEIACERIFHIKKRWLEAPATLTVVRLRIAYSIFSVGIK